MTRESERRQQQRDGTKPGGGGQRTRLEIVLTFSSRAEDESAGTKRREEQCPERPDGRYLGLANLASSIVGLILMSATFSVSSVFQFVRLITNGILTPPTVR